MEKEDLVAIANTAMPFGKYQGRILIDLPLALPALFSHKGEFPERWLGQLMNLALSIKIEGLDSLITPLKQR